MQQPPSQDPNRLTGQSSPRPQSEQPSFPPPPPLQPSQGRYPLGEEAYYNQQPPFEGPATQYRTGQQGKLNTPAKSGNIWRTATLVLFILVLILGTTTFLVLRHTSTSPTTIAPAATPQGGHSAPVPTATSPAVASPTSTPASSSGTVAAAQPAATVASGIITENLLLTCGANCNDPIHVTITTIQVDDANGNMVWNISMKNVSGSSMSYGIDTFELLASGTQTQIPATFSQSGGNLPNSDPSSIQGTFSFVPVQNTTYTLTVVVAENPYMGPQITFDPVQITNL